MFLSRKKALNEICYKFITLQSTNLLKQLLIEIKTFFRAFVANVIAMTQMYFKAIYDDNHALLQINVDDWALLRVHKKYKISFIVVSNRKFSQQEIEIFKILKRINNLAYKLNIFKEWRIWSIISIAQLKFLSTSHANSFKRNRASFFSVTIKEKSKSNNVKSFEIEQIIVKRNNCKKNQKYLIK